MEINCKEIRENARLSLKGKWGVAILSSLVYSFVNILANLFLDLNSMWINILSIISSALFIFGYTAIILHIVRGENAEISQVFTECKRFLKGLGMTLVVGIYTMLWTCLLIIPGIIAAIKYSMTFYIWVDNPDIGINDAIIKSIEMTDGHKLDIFKLILSFIGWFILIFGIGLCVGYWSMKCMGILIFIEMVLLSPYIEVAMGNFYTKLLKNMKINKN